MPIHMRMRKLRGPNKKQSMPFEFPSRGIAAYAATDEQSDNLGIIQNQTPVTLGFQKKYRLAIPRNTFNSTGGIRFCRTGSSVES